ncbi:hypothetical protein C0Q70_06817 [Pomacea canaliculata]|uniref:B box-type domain-containing protein n=1 Tax=Pomacea canaliculata TaxID=400727 RepID=A0A2T7PDA7_POMCA|nr:uncharacterized protein LOC112562526 [Pomacea canaliculata]XP_025091594.1 uncharacterized protein LOC112562526 [Pomacea canaliculata]PVD31405.1 hypothetical protein C0Q70_06817 [Pomacea canaliculata]
MLRRVQGSQAAAMSAHLLPGLSLQIHHRQDRGDWDRLVPMSFLQKPIQPELRGEARTWADSFPTNFFLSQLSSKLQTMASSGHMSNSVFNGETTAKAICTKHAKMALAAYCTQKRRSVCEECCVQTHLDCIQYHVSERDSRAIADERKLKLKQDFDLLKIRLEGLMDKVNSHVTELNSKKEQLQLQTEAAVSEVKTKLELMVLEQKRELGRQLDMLVDRERRRLSGVKERALEVSQVFDKMAETLSNVEGGACSTLDGLTALNDVEEELKKQEQVMESTRKDSTLSEIVFYPDKTFETLFRKLTFGTFSLERKPQDSSGARPRTHRYSSDPNSYSSPLAPRDSVLLLQQRSVPGDEAWDDVSLGLGPSFSSQKGRIARRGFSPPGAAASAPATATPSGATTVESDLTDHMRQKLEVPKNSQPPVRRSPTSPDFGSTVIEEAKSRSRSLPRRRRPRSEGAFPPGARRRHALRSVDDERDVAHGRRSSEKSCSVTPSPTVVYDNDTPASKLLPRSSDSGDNSKNGGSVYTSDEEFSSLGSEALSRLWPGDKRQPLARHFARSSLPHCGVGRRPSACA